MENRTFKIIRLEQRGDALDTDESIAKALGDVVSKIAAEFQKKPFSAPGVKSLANQIADLANKKAQLK